LPDHGADDSTPVGDEAAYVAYLDVALPSSAATPMPMDDAWLRLCNRLTSRVEVITDHRAFLALDRCSSAEAEAALTQLLEQLGWVGYVARAGVGPNLLFAQLVALRAATPERMLALVTPTDAPALLRSTPVALVSQLHPRGAITAAVVERLQRYGLRTLGHVARLTEEQLRRQFGGATGATLAALAQGRDPQPLTPTAPTPRTTLRFRLPTPLTPDALLALTPTFGARLATQLRQRDQSTQGLSIHLRWESGARTSARATLRQPTAAASQLTTDLRRLLTSLVSAQRQRRDAIDDLQVTLEDVRPLLPTQITLWRAREAQARRHATLRAVAETLAQRYRRPVLAQARLAAPDAIFREDRYALAQASLAADSSAPATPQRETMAPSADPWRDVPQRLHWW